MNFRTADAWTSIATLWSGLAFPRQVPRLREQDLHSVFRGEIPETQQDRPCQREIAKRYGIEMPTERVPVFHHGERIGTVPAEFDPSFIKSKSFFYDPRPGDFTRTAEGWQAHKSLGPGDISAIPGFAAEQRPYHKSHW